MNQKGIAKPVGDEQITDKDWKRWLCFIEGIKNLSGLFSNLFGAGWMQDDQS